MLFYLSLETNIAQYKDGPAKIVFNLKFYFLEAFIAKCIWQVKDPRKGKSVLF